MNLSGISFCGKAQTKIIKNTVRKAAESSKTIIQVSAGSEAKTHFYTPRRSAETVQRDLERLRLILKNATENNEILSRKEVAYRAGITTHQLNNMINKGQISSETMALYDLVKIKNPDKFKPLTESETGSRIDAIRQGINKLYLEGKAITGEKLSEITGISVHKVRRILASNTADLNTLKKSVSI